MEMIIAFHWTYTKKTDRWRQLSYIILHILYNIIIVKQDDGKPVGFLFTVNNHQLATCIYVVYVVSSSKSVVIITMYLW